MLLHLFVPLAQAVGSGILYLRFPSKHICLKLDCFYTAVLLAQGAQILKLQDTEQACLTL